MGKKVQFLKWITVALTICFSTGLSAQIIGFGSNWHYKDDGSDQGTAWKDVGFDDSAWPDGNAGLGYPSGAGISTLLSYGSDANNKYITTYFRKTVNIPDVNVLQYVKLTLKRDDGAVIYINGVEMIRSNMPATGAITYQTLAPGNENVTIAYTIPASAFVQGNNVIAVSIHQTAVTSSDLLFDLSLENVTDQLVVGAGTGWKYKDTGTDLGTTWTDGSYDDSAWPTGLAPLGYTAPGVVTNVSFGPNSAAKYPTTYFRKKVTLTAGDLAVYDSVRISLTIDDGAIVYLNGTEIMRKNMPASGVTYSTLANVTVGSTPSTFTATLPKTAFITGDNYFAVEIHQVTAGSSDIFFNLSATPTVNDVQVVSAGTNWKYNDTGVAPASDWNTLIYNDAAWAVGNAPLGYGNGDEATTVSYGPSEINKHMTTYFRKHFDIVSLAGYANVRLQLKRDDAARIFINGVDVYRSNLEAGTIDFSSAALMPVEGAEENQWITVNLPVSVLQIGTNVIAVEVHKYNAIETDLRFALTMDLQSQSQTPSNPIQNVTCNPNTNTEIGCFTSVMPTAQTQGLVIPSTHTFQLIMKQGMSNFYSNSTRAVPSNTDFTGYVSPTGSSREGVVSVNHETDPGDVSLVSVHFIDSTKLWAVDSARLVDFAPLVRTTRNCSGGVTPWRTIVTSEETYATGDVNGDGYHDRGWQVEIDPVSGNVIDQNNDGTPDKLWAMGRMNHENICVSADSTVAYQAEDGGTSGVYKYVMTVKGKLNAGTLYVLKRDNATSSTGTWIQVPNTTQAERNTVSTVITSLGGTNWNGPEDVEFGPDGKMYFTSKGTGTIWRFEDNGMTVSGIEAWVTNTNYTITHSNGVTAEGFGTGIDNLAFDNEGNLWAQQDGGRGHLWVIRPDHTPAAPKVDLFCVTPAGSEPTGLTFTPDGRYGFISFQHPSGTATVVDAGNQNVIFNGASTVVFARKEFLGAQAIEPRFELGNTITACDRAVLFANSNNDVVNVWQDNSTLDSLVVTQTGWYKATAYANNGRMYTDSVFVTINSTPAAPSMTDAVACFGTAVADLQASGTAVSWYSDAALTTQVHSGNNFASGQTAVGQFTYYATQTQNGCVSPADSAMVTINALPSAPVTAGASVCEGVVTPALNATGTSVLWYDDAALTSQVAVGSAFASPETAAGTYTYYATQTDANGCLSPGATALLEIKPLPAAPVSTNETVCETAVVPDLSATGTTIAWYNDASLNTLVGAGNNLSTGQTAPGTYTYYATQTAANGCTGPAATAILTINALPSAPVVSSATACQGTSLPALTATGTSVVWYADAVLGTSVATGNIFAAGVTTPGVYDYFATQTDVNGCTSLAATAMVTINALPSTPATLSATVCQGGTNPPLTATGTAVAWYSNAGLTNQVATGNTFTSAETATGTYTYYATQTDANGCVSPGAIAVFGILGLPSAPATTNVTACANETVPDLTAVGSSVEWYADAALNTSLETGTVFTTGETTPGTYTYYVTQTAGNGCEGPAATAILTINAFPSAPSGSSVAECEGNVVPDLTASGSSVEWYADAALNTQVATGNTFASGQTAPGTYSYFATQTDANGCVSTPLQLTLTINPIPVAPVISGQTAYCAGDSFDALTANGNNITWYDDNTLTNAIANGNSFTPSVNQTTVFYATQTVLGCTSPSGTTTVTIHQLPVVSISGLNANYGDAHAAATLVGTPAGGTFSGTGVDGNQFDPSMAGVGGPYTVTYTYTDPVTGCGNSATTAVSVTSSVGLVELSNGNSYEVFPNPVDEVLTLKVSLAEGTTVGAELFDEAGRTIVVQPAQQMGAGVHTISAERSALNIANGAYWLKVMVGNETSTYKVVFQ
ncbi:MAG TPA: alkaline phosphatase PhoX [Fluviicola sp.]|nr:alkaline phosphatase PhoX [Fluviicola sp.]